MWMSTFSNGYPCNTRIKLKITRESAISKFLPFRKVILETFITSIYTRFGWRELGARAGTGEMGNMGYKYKRVGRRSWHGGRGFRLNPKRFSVLIRVRVRLMYLFRLCGQAVESLKRGISRSRSTKKGSDSSRSRMSLMMESGDCRFRSFGRTNSFYSEAIADCLEFIKRSSLSVDDIAQAANDIDR